MMSKRDELIKEHAPKVEMWVKSFVGKTGTSEDFDDLLSEAYVSLLETIDRYLDGKVRQLSAYARQSCCNAMYDYLRRRSLIPVRSKNPPVILHSASFVSPDSGDPEFETWEAIRLVIKDWRDRAIVAAKLNGCKTDVAVAKVTGFSRTTIRGRIARMMRKYEKVTR